MRQRAGVFESNLIYFFIFSRHRPSNANGWSRPGELPQRYGDALNANVHFHSLVIDGVYAAGEDGRPQFHVLPAPEDEDVLRLTMLVSQRVQSLLKRLGVGTETDSQQADPLSENDPGMAALLASSVRRRIAVGSNTAHPACRHRKFT